MFREWLQVGQEASALLPWCGCRVASIQASSQAVPATISFLASTGWTRICMCGVFSALWFVSLGFFGVFLYTWVFKTILKPKTYLCVLLNLCPVLWVMSEAPGISLALQCIVIVQTMLSKNCGFFPPSNIYTPILLV